MAQSFFQFKQFRIAQDRCGMKVSTDACIQGAWTAKYLQAVNPEFILDIGTGTGLLTLMLAQQLKKSRLLAIEPEPGACGQAAENFALSPWGDRITLKHNDLGGFLQSDIYTRIFDVIICNPPFFEGQLNARDLKRNRARHDALPMEQLAGSAIQLIRPSGVLSVLYPEREWPAWLNCVAAAGWHLNRELRIVPRAGKAANRRIGLFSDSSRSSCRTIREELIIYEAPGRYTPTFMQLLQPYYLYL